MPCIQHRQQPPGNVKLNGAGNDYDWLKTRNNLWRNNACAIKVGINQFELMEAKQRVQVDGAQNIIVQVEGDGNHLNVGLPHLTLIPPRKRAPRVRTEIDLLNPYARAFDLVGREKDMASLWEWLHSQRSITVRTLIGRAGAGKTRLAIELIERLHTTEAGQWWAGFVSGTEMRRFGSQQNLAGWGWSKPTIIVVDYAASLTEPLGEWLRELAQNDRGAEGRPLRLLLLEREASVDAGWLQFLCREVVELLAARLNEIAMENPTEAVMAEQSRFLNNLANRLSDLGRREEALAQAEESVRIRKQLAQACPDAFLPDLAGSCRTRGKILQRMNNYVAAAASFAQGIQALTPLFQKMPPVFSSLVNQVCGNYIGACERAKTEPDTALLAPVLEVFKQLENNKPKE